MATERKVKCNQCGHIWMSQAMPVNLKCKKCGFAAVQDNYVEPEGKITAMLISTAETVGLSDEQILACKTAEELQAVIDAATSPPETVHVKADGRTLDLPRGLYDRACVAGLLSPQITAFPDVESLKAHLDKISPETGGGDPASPPAPDTPPPAPETVHVESGGCALDVPRELYDRCSKVIGMSDAMIARYPDVEALKQGANGMHPKSNVDARVKQGQRPEPAKFAENMQDSFTLESVLEAKCFKTNRDHFDRGDLQAFLRRINRRYGPQNPVRIVQDRTFKVVDRGLVTRYTIYYKE